MLRTQKPLIAAALFSTLVLIIYLCGDGLSTDRITTAKKQLTTENDLGWQEKTNKYFAEVASAWQDKPIRDELFQTPDSSRPEHCPDLPGSSDVLLVLKTGATEIDAKLPVHFLTTFACVSDYLVFSDMAQDVGSHRVHDALVNVTEYTKYKSGDFDVYHAINMRHRDGLGVSNLKGHASWALDKWKFLPMVKAAYEMYPNKKWYFLMEADTYLSWPNLLMWLQRLDHRQAVYAGANIFIRDVEFAHGGSGILLSRPAIEALDKIYTNLTQATWENATRSECCGDKVLAEALLQGGVKLLRAFPLIQGEAVWSLDWSQKHWCRPAITWHHVSPAEINMYWQFDRKWTIESQRWKEKNGRQRPMLFKDIWAHWVKPHMQEELDDWDNMSSDWIVDSTKDVIKLGIEQHASTTNQTGCRAYCDSHLTCVQWRWRNGECSGSQVMRLGKSAPAERSKSGKQIRKTVSGWLLKKTQAAIAKMDSCGEQSTWITSS